jgi:hypothetical protein
MKNMKRIAAITIKRMTDTDPDTSYLGEYSNDAETDYAIDRKHAEDCQSQEFNHRATVEQLERIISYLTAVTYGTDLSDDVRETASEAQDVLIELQNEAQECDCSGGEMGRNEYRFFNANVENYKGESPADIRKYVRQDYERMERLHRGDWGYISIRAEAEVCIPSGAGDAGIVQEITSGGLYGIESDSDKDYLASIEGEELGELRKQLYTLGFSKRAIATACKNVTHKDA